MEVTGKIKGYQCGTSGFWHHFKENYDYYNLEDQYPQRIMMEFSG
jgi:hypothetical protein